MLFTLASCAQVYTVAAVLALAYLLPEAFIFFIVSLERFFVGSILAVEEVIVQLLFKTTAMVGPITHPTEACTLAGTAHSCRREAAHSHAHKHTYTHTDAHMYAHAAGMHAQLQTRRWTPTHTWKRARRTRCM